MAVVDVIDLTVSPPPSSVIVIDDVEEPAYSVPIREENSKEQKKRKKRERGRDRRERRREGEEDQRYNGSGKPDKFLDVDRDRQGNKRKKADNGSSTRSTSSWRLRTPLFQVDTARDLSLSIPPPMNHDLTDSIPREPAVEPPANLPVDSSETGLLLPAHVTVSAQEPVTLPKEDSRMSPDLNMSGIDFLDDDRAVGAPRYFHDTHIKSARSRGPCTRCGDDDHDFKSCPNIVCITCGARNEHGSRSCPILRHCWSCKAKGHLAKDCPHLGNMDLHQLNREDCERCGSWKHHGTNCPSLWRIYTYLTDADREAVLDDRESKRELGFDNGGEGYIAYDPWCYNCGGGGHLGDDCEATSPNHDRPNDYSAFGTFNKLSGPFASSSYPVPKFERPQRQWEQGDRFDDGYGFSADNNVGKRGRENAKAKAREAHRKVEEVHDETDWFNINRAGSANDRDKTKPGGKSGLPPKPPPPIVHFGVSGSNFSKAQLDSGNRPRPPQPSLRDRIDMDDRRPTEYSHRDRDRWGIGSRDRRRDEAESRRRNRDRVYSVGDAPRRDRGSRWRGGYDR